MRLVLARHLYNDGGSWSRCRVNISAISFAQAAGRRLVIALQSGWLLQTLFAFFGGVHFPGGPHQVGLPLLIFRQFVEHVAELVIAAALRMLRRAEHLVDARAQGLRTIDDEQIGAICRQTAIADA